ncbi:hypothetical protein HMI54_007592 [Coelomomyces lativittatus]|nr:hypothetical protein HMI56_007662 [Coelomomyces lativittatus]KAJ1510031.1 hypothetical protein HMI55_007157 [Coelomomyces lativittatus]KAJ1516956.1 hypothetical protein HMI54_007592 [Coelomomyces lativittatus]
MKPKGQRTGSSANTHNYPLSLDKSTRLFSSFSFTSLEFLRSITRLLINLNPFFCILCSLILSSHVILFKLSVSCAPISNPIGDSISQGDIPKLEDFTKGFEKLDGLLVSVISITLGTLCVLGGRRFSRFLIALIVGLFFAWFGFVCIKWSGAKISNTVFWGISAGLFLVGALLSVFVYTVAIVISGVVAGYFLGEFLLTLGLMDMISEKNANLFIYLFAACFGVLMFFFEKYIIALIVPLIGSYILFLGIDHFVESNFSSVFHWTINFFKGAKVKFLLSEKTILMIIGFVLVYLFGIFIHFRTRNSK